MNGPDANFYKTMERSDDALDALLSMEFPPNPHNYVEVDDVFDDLPTFSIPGEDDDLIADDLIAEDRRDSRKFEARSFRAEYFFGRSLDQKTFVCSGGTYSWDDKSSGIIWVGVHGLDSICVVTRTGDLDLTRVHRFLKYRTKEEVLFRFRKTAVSEIEDLASPSSELVKIVGQGTLKPFGVVSVIRGPENDHKESGDEMASSDEFEEVEGSEISSNECLSNEQRMDRLVKDLKMEGKRRRRQKEGPKDPGYDEKKTVKFLREQMRRDTTIQESSTMYYEMEAVHFLQDKMATMKMEAFTVDETIKTAITAFQHLFLKKFEADEIQVSVMDRDYFFSKKEPRYKDVNVKELVTSDIEDHLAAINGSGGSFGSWCHKCSCTCGGGFRHITSPTIPFREGDVKFDKRGRRSLRSYWR